MTTIVTAFLTNVNNNKNKNIEKYIEYGKKLIDISVNKIIYIEKDVYDLYFIDISNNNTVFQFIEKKDLYLYEYYNDITKFNIITDNPNKDTIEYMFVQCNKTEWVRDAIQKNFFNTDQFVWIDFGIYHVINNEQKFEEYIHNLSIKSFENIRFASGFNNNSKYTKINWFFLGGIFGGDKNSLIKFADLIKSKCIQVIKETHTIPWEVNIWYLVYLENSELFSEYKADHNFSMLSNY